MSAAGAQAGKWVGARVQRLEDPAYLTGAARYVADLTRPRVVHASFVRSTHPHARIRSVDTSRAAEAPGVVAVVTGADIAGHALVDLVPLDGLLKTPQPVLAVDRVRFVGEAIAVVVATSSYAAEDAAALVDVDYEELAPVADVESATADGAPLLFDDVPGNVVFRQEGTFGDVDGAFDAADVVVRRRYRTNRFMAAPMETRGCLAEYDGASEELTLWCSTQTPDLLRLTVSAVLGIPAQKLRVIAPEVGGGFGQKMSTHPEEVVVPYLARRLGRPVKWVEDRRENLMAATHAKEQVVDVEAAVSAEGRLLGLRARFVGDSGAFSYNTASAIVEPGFAALLMPSVYDCSNYAYEALGVLTNKAPIGPFRAVGWTAGHTARELLFDDLARELGLDPAEFRRRNMVTSERFPYETCTGHLYDSGSFVESLERALERIDYEAFRREQAEAREQGRYLGIGVSPYVEPTAFGTDVAFRSGFPLASHDNARVTVDPTGKVTVATGICSQGQGHRTVLAQVAADALGVSPEDVAVVQGDTGLTPFAMGTYASRAAVIAGGSVALAAGDVRTKLLDVAGQLLEASPADLVIEDARVFVQGSPDRALDLAAVAGAAYFAPEVRQEGVDPLPASTRFYDPKATYSNGCIAAVCEVDVETGIVDVLRVVAVEDCGTVLNPTIVEGQIRGAVAQGIGGALYEHLVYDDNAQLLTTTYLDYLLPTSAEVPAIEVDHLETPSPVTVGGVKGMGESGLIATPAAVLNAVVDAVSPFSPAVESLPLSPERVLRAIGRIDGRADA